MASLTKAELLVQAKELGIELDETSTNAQLQDAIDQKKTGAQNTVAPEVGPTEPPMAETPADASAPTEAANTGNAIAQAISEGLKEAVSNAKDEKKIIISVDNSVAARFAVVKNAQGEVMLRENETGHLSKVQLESIEEKEASIQGQEVTEI